MNYLWVLNLFLNVFLLLKFWASGFCWLTLYTAAIGQKLYGLQGTDQRQATRDSYFFIFRVEEKWNMQGNYRRENFGGERKSWEFSLLTQSRGGI